MSSPDDFSTVMKGICWFMFALFLGVVLYNIAPETVEWLERRLESDS